VKGDWIERKRVYKLTENGSKTIEAILNSHDRIKSFITTIFKP
jgi:Mn-dependent DtxR family transcriptional regulator